MLEKLTNKNSLFDTAVVSVNDEIVNLFLKKKIKFFEISKKITTILSLPFLTKLDFNDMNCMLNNNKQFYNS